MEPSDDPSFEDELNLLTPEERALLTAIKDLPPGEQQEFLLALCEARFVEDRPLPDPADFPEYEGMEDAKRMLRERTEQLKAEAERRKR